MRPLLPLLPSVAPVALRGSVEGVLMISKKSEEAVVVPDFPVKTQPPFSSYSPIMLSLVWAKCSRLFIASTL
jgi:hypothetical protein